MSVNLRDLARLVEESHTTPIVLTLTSGQVSAVEIYIVDPAHEEEPWYDKVSLRGNKFIINMSHAQAFEMIHDASNSADEGDGQTPDRGALAALSSLHSKLKAATGRAVSKPTKVAPSKLKTLRNWVYQAVNKPGANKAMLLLNAEDYKTWASEDGKDPNSSSFELSTANGPLKVYPSADVRPNEFKLR